MLEITLEMSRPEPWQPPLWMNDPEWQQEHKWNYCLPDANKFKVKDTIIRLDKFYLNKDILFKAIEYVNKHIQDIEQVVCSPDINIKVTLEIEEILTYCEGSHGASYNANFKISGVRNEENIVLLST